MTTVIGHGTLFGRDASRNDGRHDDATPTTNDPRRPSPHDATEGARAGSRRRTTAGTSSSSTTGTRTCATIPDFPGREAISSCLPSWPKREPAANSRAGLLSAPTTLPRTHRASSSSPAGSSVMADRGRGPAGEHHRSAALGQRFALAGARATAMCLQRIGDTDPAAMIALVEPLARGGALERRAAVAGLCEPRLLVHEHVRAAAFAALGSATDWLRSREPAQRRDPDVRTLRQALGYAWSVAVAADPRTGVPRFEALGDDPDSDVQWIVRENLKKARLRRAAPELVDRRS